MILEARNLLFDYGGSPALRGLNFLANAGESVAIVGPSGCGKSTLLYCLAGLLQPTSGTVLFRGSDLAIESDAARSELRLHQFGFVFQTSELVCELTLAENVALPLELVGSSRRRAATTARGLCEQLGLGDAMHRRPARVSGGQRQRAAIARAIAVRPTVIFADEPTGALDSANRSVVLEVLLAAAQSVGALLLVVTHDSEVAAALSRRVELRDGAAVDATGSNPVDGR